MCTVDAFHADCVIPSHSLSRFTRSLRLSPLVAAAAKSLRDNVRNCVRRAFSAFVRRVALRQVGRLTTWKSYLMCMYERAHRLTWRKISKEFSVLIIRVLCTHAISDRYVYDIDVSHIHVPIHFLLYIDHLEDGPVFWFFHLISFVGYSVRRYLNRPVFNVIRCMAASAYDLSTLATANGQDMREWLLLIVFN